MKEHPIQIQKQQDEDKKSITYIYYKNNLT